MTHITAIDELVALRQRIEHVLHTHGLQAKWTGFSVADSTAGPHQVRILTCLAEPDDDRFEEVIAQMQTVDNAHYTDNDT